MHVHETFPQMSHLQIITKYLDLLNIKIQFESTYLNHVPFGLLLLPQEVPLGLNDHGTRQHQNKHICQKDNKKK